MTGPTVGGGAWLLRRPAWWPPAELLVAPALVILLLNAVTTSEALFPNQGDVLLYFRKAEALAAGGMPYRDFAFEYPPLALVSMAVPYVAWPAGNVGFDLYRWLFTAWQAILLVGMAIVAARLADLLAEGSAILERASSARRAGTRLVILVLVTAPSLTFRFDLLPALLTALAVVAILERRAGWAGVLIGLGALVKLYPLVLVPVVVAIWLARGDRMGLVAFFAGLGFTVAIVLLPFSVLAGDAAWSFVTYHSARGLQVESVAAGFILLGAVLRGQTVPFEFEFGAVHVAGAAADRFLAVQPVLLVLGPLVVAAIGYLVARSEVAALGRVRAATVIGLALAVVTMFIVTNKVVSVQYVVWLLPLAALLAGGPFWLAAVIGALSIIIHPAFYESLLRQELGIILVLCLRNLLLIGLLAWVLTAVLRTGPPAVTAELRAPAG